MFSYVSNKRNFLKDFCTGHIASWLEKEINSMYDSDVERTGEMASWRNTLPYMATIFLDERIPDSAEIVMEYILEKEDAVRSHNGNKIYRRVDVMVAGEDMNGDKNIILLEFKQYSNLRYDAERGEYINQFYNRTYEGNPFEQVDNYRNLIRCYNQKAQENNINLYTVVCLLNLNIEDENSISAYTLSKINEERGADAVFFEGQLNELKDYIIEKVGRSTDTSVMTEFAQGEPMCRHEFHTNIGRIFADEEITLRVDQDILFNKLVSNGGRIDEILQRDDGLTHIIGIEGDPGSGKSILALMLYKHYIENGLVVKFMGTGSALLDTLKIMFPEINREDILYPNRISESVDIIIFDEMHRGTGKDIERTLGLNSDNGLYRHKIIIAFYDKHQNHTINANGISFLREHSVPGENQEENDFGLVWDEDDNYILSSQFRCGGDKGYIKWLDKLFYGAYYPFDRSSVFYDFGIVEDFQELVERVNDPDTLVLAGPFATDSSMTIEGETEFLQIANYNNFRRNNAEINNAFTYHHYTDDINYFGINDNVQGLESKNVVVIIGNEIFVRNGEISLSDDAFDNEKARKKYLGMSSACDYKNFENGGRDLTDAEKAEMENCIKNIYRVLLTRGLKSCRIYCENEEVKNIFRGIAD